jgi:hypothetical protein
MSLQVLGLLLYFGLGVMSDICVTAYYICVGQQWAIPASLVSILIALLNFWVIDKVLITVPSWDKAVAYAIGNAVGCFIIITITKRLKRSSI